MLALRCLGALFVQIRFRPEQLEHTLFLEIKPTLVWVCSRGILSRHGDLERLPRCGCFDKHGVQLGLMIQTLSRANRAHESVSNRRAHRDRVVSRRGRRGLMMIMMRMMGLVWSTSAFGRARFELTQLLGLAETRGERSIAVQLAETRVDLFELELANAHVLVEFDEWFEHAGERQLAEYTTVVLFHVAQEITHIAVQILKRKKEKMFILLVKKCILFI